MDRSQLTTLVLLLAWAGCWWTSPGRQQQTVQYGSRVSRWLLGEDAEELIRNMNLVLDGKKELVIETGPIKVHVKEKTWAD